MFQLSGTPILSVLPITLKRFKTIFFDLLVLKFIIARAPHSDYDNLKKFIRLNSLKNRRKESYIIF